MKFLKVPRKLAEKTRLELVAEGLFSTEYEIFEEDDFIFIPVKGKYKDFEVVEREAEKQPPRHQKLEGVLSAFLNRKEMESVVTSYDMIGDIVIAEIPKELEPKEKKIGEALLKVHKNVKTVLKKHSPMEGEYRVRKLKHLAGEKKTETLYKEHGCTMKLDVARVYFSVRLSHERKRVANLVKPGEKILALFAGIGPFPLVISKSHPDAEIVAVEINPEAVKYMEENVKLNKAKNITVIEGDARKIVIEKYKDFADRVLMPLPKTAETFLDVAFAGAKDSATIHFYTFAGAKEPFKEAIEKAMAAAKASNISAEVLSQRIARPYSPGVVQVVLDLLVRKNQ
jgi:tRNA (guanine37-N1)-methyltransferase